ncbi:sulfurtransferase complex subunit TusC [Marinobacteraceae bacterium S3BR75-40.1]
MSHTSFLFIADKAPYDTLRCKELLDMITSAAAFDQKACLLLLGDGVLWALAGQEPAALDQKNVSKQLGMLPIYGVESLYVSQQALHERGLEADALVDGFRAIDPEAIAGLYEDYQQVVPL